MKLSWRKTIAAVAVGSVGVFGLVGQAGASDPIANSGQDNVNDQILGGGSDTTFVMENELAQLYNQSPGGVTDNTSGSATLGQITTSPNAAPTANQNDNWDHDIVANAYPTGSGAGIAGIGTKFDFARSSRVATAGELATRSAWGFGKDGIVMVTPPGRTVSSLTKAQIQGIYAGTITNWNQIPGQAAGTIHAYGMNPSSGTYGTFKTYIGAEPNNSGVTPGAGVGLGGNTTFPFENDFKPVLADITARGWIASDVIWWGSFGEFKTYPYKSQGASFWQNNGVTATASTIRTNAFDNTRILYRIAATSSIQLGGGNAADTPLTTTGATSGKAGAVRRYFDWVCEPTSYFDAAGTNTALNPFFGTNYYDLIGQAITNSGFQRTPAAERNAGACKVNA